MNSIGKMLRQAREERGYTQSQIADSTRILVQIIKGLEEEDFSSIVAPIYGRGFVKLYAEVVGLDPKECIDAFMEAYNRKPAKVDAPPEGIQIEAEINEEPPIKRAFEQDLPPLGEPEIDNQTKEVAPTPLQTKASLAGRYVAPVTRNLPKKQFPIPPYIWRLALVIAATIAIIWAVTITLKALYRATCTETNNEPSEIVQQASPTENENALPPQPQQERKVEKLPDFYID